VGERTPDASRRLLTSPLTKNIVFYRQSGDASGPDFLVQVEAFAATK
jgi:hypothetical protein